METSGDSFRRLVMFPTLLCWLSWMKQNKCSKEIHDLYRDDGVSSYVWPSPREIHFVSHDWWIYPSRWLDSCRKSASQNFPYLSQITEMLRPFTHSWSSTERFWRYRSRESSDVSLTLHELSSREGLLDEGR